MHGFSTEREPGLIGGGDRRGAPSWRWLARRLGRSYPRCGRWDVALDG